MSALKNLIKNRKRKADCFMKKHRKLLCAFALSLSLCCLLPLAAFAAGDVAGAIEGTWEDASVQIKQVVNNVVFPVIDLILAVFFFGKLGMAYFDYRKQGMFEWTAPAILFACLVFTLTAPLYIWTVIGI
jgi:hypothetical protein